MLIRDVMTIDQVHVTMDATLRRAAEIVSLAEVSDLMVVDHHKRFIGVLSEGDMLRALLPDFQEIITAGGSLSDAFRFFVDKGRDLASRPIAPLVITDAITMLPTDEVAMAAAVMTEKQIRRLPVVEDGALVGTVSRADLCRAVIYYAESEDPGDTSTDGAARHR